MKAFLSTLRKFTRARNEVESYGFKRSFGSRYGPWVFISIILVAAVLAGLLVQFLPFRLSGADVPTGVVAIGAIILGYQQWRAARNELTLDKFYERLEVTNRKIEDWHAVRLLLDLPLHEASQDFTERELCQRAMYTFRELDNLEYAIVKYKLGYMSSEHALRSLRLFKHRCESPMFLELAKRCCTEENAYEPGTVEVVKRVCSKFSSPTH